MTSEHNGKTILTAKEGDTVRVHFECRLDDGSVFATTANREEPKEIVLGKSTVIPGLQEALLGMAADEEKTFRIPPDKAYGPYHEEMTATIDRSIIPADLDIEVGVVIKVKHEDGHESDAFVTAIDGDKIQIDGNHPLAGKTLTMEIRVVDVTPGEPEPDVNQH
jgi:peptidylprolyl isomerase